MAKKLGSRGTFSCGALDSVFIPKNLNMEKRVELVNSCSSATREIARELLNKNWRIFVVEQRRGRCYYGDKVITVPEWVMPGKGRGYAEYYLCHEMAHAFLHEQGKNNENHGPLFMQEFKRICPENFWHYELGYKPRNASAAGIIHIEDF